MNILYLKDKKISDEALLDAVNPFLNLYRKYGVEPNIFIEEKDFSNVEFVIYNPNIKKEEGPDYGVRKSYLTQNAKDTKKRWGYEVDYITHVIHQDNWHNHDDGVWGWNIAQPKYGYEVQVVRWDAINPANSTGTAHHETMHPHDTFCYRTIGVWLEDVVGVEDWDRDVVHGHSDDYDYIQYLENEKAIEKIAPTLKKAFARRRAMQKASEKKMKTIISLLEAVVELYNTLIIRQRKEDIKN